MARPREIVYVDGSCFDNGYSGARAGAGVYFGENDPRNIAAPVPGAQTNNRGEVLAISLALQREPHAPLEIRTDSLWALKCAQKLWKANKNLDLLQDLWALLVGRDVVFTWVKGHESPENLKADALAKQGATFSLSSSSSAAAADPEETKEVEF